MRNECPNPNPDCKYYRTPEGCYSDSHHIFGRPKSGHAKKFANLPTSKEQLCRAEHEDIHATIGVEDLPSLDIMKQAIARSLNDG